MNEPTRKVFESYFDTLTVIQCAGAAIFIILILGKIAQILS